MSRKWMCILAVVGAAALAGAVVLPIPFDEWRTLASLKKVDDHPLYVMTFYGDYGFEEAQSQEVVGAREAAVASGAPGQLWACTCFASLGKEADVLLGRNFDWYNHPALLLFTDPPQAYASVSMVDIAYLGFDQQAPSWTGRRRLLLAPYLPFDGMNEQGLGVGMMAVPAADSGYNPRLRTLDSLQVIRLLLDYAADVEEAVVLLEGCNIDFGGGPPVHYLLADASGRSAVVEFVNGEMKVMRNIESWQVSTNFVISQAMPQGAGSECWRYNLAYDALAGAEGALTPSAALDLLHSVSQPSTIWSLVYGLDSGDINVVMGRHYDNVHHLGL